LLYAAFDVSTSGILCQPCLVLHHMYWIFWQGTVKLATSMTCLACTCDAENILRWQIYIPSQKTDNSAGDSRRSAQRCASGKWANAGLHPESSDWSSARQGRPLPRLTKPKSYKTEARTLDTRRTGGVNFSVRVRKMNISERELHAPATRPDDAKACHTHGTCTQHVHKASQLLP
jgi:hypothetical protein